MNYPAANSGVSRYSKYYYNNAASGGVLDPGYAIKCLFVSHLCLRSAFFEGKNRATNEIL